MLLEYLKNTATCLMSKADTRHRRELIDYDRPERPIMHSYRLCEASHKAENRAIRATLLAGSNVSFAELAEVPLSRSVYVTHMGSCASRYCVMPDVH